VYSGRIIIIIIIIIKWKVFGRSHHGPVGFLALRCRGMRTIKKIVINDNFLVTIGSCEDEKGCDGSQDIMVELNDDRQQHNSLLYIIQGCIHYNTTPLQQ
jgi:hypothetical protein